jgi:predicted Zn-dependent peptidase
LKNDLINQEELSEVKNYLKGSILNTLTTPFALTDKLKNIFFYDLGSDFYEKLFDDIDAATSMDLLNLANSTLFDKSLSSIIVG